MSSVVCDLEIRSWDLQHGLSYLTIQLGRNILNSACHSSFHLLQHNTELWEPF